MIKLNQTFDLCRSIMKSEYFHYSPDPKNKTITPNNPVFVDIPKELSLILLKGSSLKLPLFVFRENTVRAYAVAQNKTILSLGPYFFN